MVAVVAAALLVMGRSTAAMASLGARLASTSATVGSPIPAAAAATWRIRTCAPPPVHRRRRRCRTARVRWVAWLVGASWAGGGAFSTNL